MFRFFKIDFDLKAYIGGKIAYSTSGVGKSGQLQNIETGPVALIVY